MCKEPENHEHVIQCTSDFTKTTFINAYGELDDWIQNTSSKEISEAVYILLTNYREADHHDTLIYPAWTRELQEAVIKQRQIGHRSFIEGFLSHHWTEAQNTHYNITKNTKNCADVWTARLIAKLWTFSHTMWKACCDFLHKGTT